MIHLFAQRCASKMNATKAHFTTSAKTDRKPVCTDVVAAMKFDSASRGPVFNMAEMKEERAVTVFREYLRIKTVQPNPDYASAIKFLEKIAQELELPITCVKVQGSLLEVVAVVITWEGTDPSLPSIMLNSHIDVVPVFPEHWTWDPFSAHKTDDGNIYARGSQDMKCVGIQYIEAVRRMKSEGKRLPRTIHLTFVPDEEIGGLEGMVKFLQTKEFKDMNVGFALDEGLASPTDVFSVFYSERLTWWLKVTCRGGTGHGSRFVENTAAEKLSKVVQSFLAFRETEKKRLESDPNLKLGDVSTINWNMVEGGVQANVVPSEMSAVFDIRITPTSNIKAFEEQIAKWCAEAGEDVTFVFLQRTEQPAITSTSEDDPWWNAFSSACTKMGMKIEKEIFSAGTDSRYVRGLGIPALGFSPMNNTPILLHEHNEFLNERVFVRGIDIYTELLTSLAKVPGF